MVGYGMREISERARDRKGFDGGVWAGLKSYRAMRWKYCGG